MRAAPVRRDRLGRPRPWPEDPLYPRDQDGPLLSCAWTFCDADELRGWRPDVKGDRPGNPRDFTPHLTALEPDEGPLTALLRFAGREKA